MDDTTPAPTPSPAMRSLDRLVGTLTLPGGTTGTVTDEWMEGGFLLQHVDMHLGLAQMASGEARAADPQRRDQ